MSIIKMSYEKMWNKPDNDSDEWPPGGEKSLIPEDITTVYGTVILSETILPETPLIPEGLRLILGIFLFVVFAIGVTGNLVVISVFTRTKSLRTPHNLLIINLAYSDLLMVVTMFPVMFISVAKKRWILGDIGCDIYAFFGSLFGIGSLCILTAIAYDRRCAICSINNTTGTGSYRRVLCLSTVAWIYSFFWSVLPLAGKGDFVLEGYKLNCSFDYISKKLGNKLYVGFLFAGAFFIPMTIIIYSYARIVIEVKKSRQSLLDMGKSSIARTHKRKVRNYETAKIGMKLITLFVLSWGPYASVAFIGQFINPELVFPMIQLIPVVMAKSASVWNPIIYAISHSRFKRELRGMFLEKCCAGMPMTETSVTSHTHSITRNFKDIKINHQENTAV